ncbi:MAG: ribosome biogenesis GTPase Der [Chthoniobacterales bacterium]
MARKLQSIAIVGRPNVGKSAIFNRLTRSKTAIVHDQPGVTRDRIVGRCTEGKIPFEIIDTGGIGSSPDPDFAEQTHDAAEVAMRDASLILFVVDAKQGMTPVDADLALQLRKNRRKVVLIVNKVDHERMENMTADFSKLGFPDSLTLSAAHGRGFNDLLQRIDTELKAKGAIEDSEDEEDPASPPRITIIGRPNVGKSSLINAILNDERTIVSDIAGTTRDAVDVRYTHQGREFILCDTAGIRHRSRHDTSVEVFSVMRSEKSIERAELCILVVDSTMGVTSQDKKIASLIEKAGKACMVVMNKWDLVKAHRDSKDQREKLVEEAQRRLFFLDYAPVVVLSAKEREALPQLFRQIIKVEAEGRRRIGTGVLNRLLTAAMQHQPPPIVGTRRFKLLYATQPEMNRPFQPARVVLFVNDRKLLPDTYRTYLEGVIRRHCPYSGIPVHFELRGREVD